MLLLPLLWLVLGSAFGRAAAAPVPGIHGCWDHAVPAQDDGLLSAAPGKRFYDFRFHERQGHCKSRAFRKRQRGLPASTPVLPLAAAFEAPGILVHASDSRLSRRLPYRQLLHSPSQYGYLFRLTPF